MFEQLPFATIDHLRPITQGHQEVIFCPDKTIGQVVAIAERLEAAGGSFLATRADPGQSAALATRFPRAEVNGLGRTVYLPPDPELVVAGMDGALASVVGGLVKVPVIAVPTSVGYGASFGGLAALLAMLNSCASGVTVVNIDNGFGAAAAASRINHS